ncbi:GLNA1-like protein, partial [Mya arenaria]
MYPMCIDCPVKTITQYDSAEEIEPEPELATVPVAMCRDPFRQGRHKIVLCEPEYIDRPGQHVEYNRRVLLGKTLSRVTDQEPWFGFEQEYFLVDATGRPLEWDSYPDQRNLQNELFVGNNSGMERTFFDTHLHACLYAGLKMYGGNREGSPSMWEYQIGPLPGLEAADQLLLSRYILIRLAESVGLYVKFGNPEVLKSCDGRIALHTNFSTKKSRAEGGLRVLKKMAENIERHDQALIMSNYDNAGGATMEWFLSGRAAMPSYDNFQCKVGCKEDCSLRIPAMVAQAGKGYIEERRPTGDANPYD